MALNTAQDLIDFALRVSSVTGQGQSPSASDEADGLLLLNMLLSEWQLNRWLTWTLTGVALVSTGVENYTVGQGGDFNISYQTQRPERIDNVMARTAGADVTLYPFISREGFNRVASKGLGGDPESYYYDAAFPLGVLHLYPVPDPTWTLTLMVKSNLGQFALGDALNALPRQYTTALLWNLAERMRPLYGMQPRPDITQMAAQSLIAIGGSQAQMIQAQQPVPSNRAGVFSHVVAPQQGAGR